MDLGGINNRLYILNPNPNSLKNSLYINSYTDKYKPLDFTFFTIKSLQFYNSSQTHHISPNLQKSSIFGKKSNQIASNLQESSIFCEKSSNFYEKSHQISPNIPKSSISPEKTIENSLFSQILQKISNSCEKPFEKNYISPILLAIAVFGGLVFNCPKAFANEGVLNTVLTKWDLSLKVAWPKILQVLKVLKDQGLILAALLALSAFFSLAETSITTLWPWKVRELAEKEPQDNGVFKMIRSDVTRFFTTILIGTTVVNIAATALVTEAATAIFGEAGVGAATGVMTVVILLITEITPKSVAVHNATDVARFVARPVALLSVVLYPVGRVFTYLSVGMLKMLGLKAAGEPIVTEEELKLMLRGAESSRAIEEEEQDMIENVLEIKETHVREVMTPLVDVVAIDASATLIDFQNLWVTHQYSRVPVFEQRVDNIVGIAYAMDLLDYVQKGELLESSVVNDMAHKPGYFVPDSMSVWNLLREFRIRKVHMAVVLNEYGGTVGIVTLEDVVEEIVGEIFDENDSKEEIERKTGYIVMRAEGIYDVDANTSIDQFCEDLNIKMPEDHQCETVSGFVCEVFGNIPRTGDTTKVVLEKGNQEENDKKNEAESERLSQKDKQKEKNQIFKLEIIAGNARKVSSVRFERLNDEVEVVSKDVTRLVPKIMKRRWNSYEDPDKIDPNDVAISTKDHSDGVVNNEHQHSFEIPIKEL